MKKIIFFFAIATQLSCTEKYTHVATSHPTDTVKTFCVYLPKVDLPPVADLLFRITKDTVGYLFVDSVTAKKRIISDSFYFAPKLDTLKNAAGVAMIDSATKKTRMTINYYPIPKNRILVDANINIDSIIKAHSK